MFALAVAAGRDQHPLLGTSPRPQGEEPCSDEERRMRRARRWRQRRRRRQRQRRRAGVASAQTAAGSADGGGGGCGGTGGGDGHATGPDGQTNKRKIFEHAGAHTNEAKHAHAPTHTHTHARAPTHPRSHPHTGSCEQGEMSICVAIYAHVGGTLKTLWPSG